MEVSFENKRIGIDWKVLLLGKYFIDISGHNNPEYFPITTEYIASYLTPEESRTFFRLAGNSSLIV